MRMQPIGVALSLALVAFTDAGGAVAQQAPVRSATSAAVEEAVVAARLAIEGADRAAAVSVPVTLAVVEPVMASTLPTLAALEPAFAATLPAALAAVEPALAAVAPALPALGFDSDEWQGDLVAREPWAPQDPADSLYRAARRALNEEDYARAAQLFARIHQDERYRNSEYRAIAYYYEAFARQRIGGRAELERARTALEAMRGQHADAWRDQRDAAALLARVNADLARIGDARAAQELQTRLNVAARSACTDANRSVKVEALNALLHMDAESALPILEEVMKQRGDECQAELRRKAVFLISQKRSERTTDLLLDAARSDPDPQVQEQAVFWLSQVRDDRAVTALEQVLQSAANPKLQERAVFALSQHRSQRAAELLRDFAMREDVSDEMRGNAIFWIGQHRGSDNVRFLQEIYPRLNARAVKEKVIFAISQIRGDASADWLLARALDQNENIELRKNALFWAGQQRTLPVARLSELYDRVTDRELKKQLVFVLSQRNRDPAAVDVLMKIAQNEKDPEIRKNAIFWLGQSKDPRAAKFLLELIRS